MAHIIERKMSTWPPYEKKVVDCIDQEVNGKLKRIQVHSYWP